MKGVVVRFVTEPTDRAFGREKNKNLGRASDRKCDGCGREKIKFGAGLSRKTPYQPVTVGPWDTTPIVSLESTNSRHAMSRLES